MDEAIRQLEENGLYDTAIQLKRDIKANKLKPYHAEQLANDLIRALKKLNKEEKKEPFAYPSKQVDRSKVIKSNPVDQKVLQRFVNKMMIAKNLDQANKENLFPNIDHVSNMKVDQDVTIEHESDTSAVFKPSSLDGPKRDPKFEIYKNRAYDKDSSYPASEKSSLPNKSGLESFAHHPKSQVNTSKANESFKEKIRSSGNAIGGIHKVEETFVGDTSSILKGIDPPEEKLDTYDDDEDQGFFIIEAAESDFLEK